MRAVQCARCMELEGQVQALRDHLADWDRRVGELQTTLRALHLGTRAPDPGCDVCALLEGETR
jgi:hypothetical protein